MSCDVVVIDKDSGELIVGYLVSLESLGRGYYSGVVFVLIN